MDFLNKVPKPLLVFGVFIIGIVAIFYMNQPHSICDSQAENIKELQQGNLYAKKINGVMTRPIYSRSVKECREGMGSPGACFELMQILKKLSVDLVNVDSSCGPTIDENLKPIRTAMAEGILTMVQIAWGESVPLPNEKKFSWLGPPEFALFCGLKDHWIRFYGEEGWESLMNSVFNLLPGRLYEVQPDGKKICTNCEHAPMALHALQSKKEVFERSLFALQCERYR
jgi:hypothetical protein